MTIEEFNNTKWKSGMLAIYRGEKFRVVGVNFTECLVEIRDMNNPGEETWVRCENVTICEG